MASNESGKRERRKGPGSGFAHPRFQKSGGLLGIDDKIGNATWSLASWDMCAQLTRPEPWGLEHERQTPNENKKRRGHSRTTLASMLARLHKNTLFSKDTLTTNNEQKKRRSFPLSRSPLSRSPLSPSFFDCSQRSDKNLFQERDTRDLGQRGTSTHGDDPEQLSILDPSLPSPFWRLLLSVTPTTTQTLRELSIS